MMERMNGLSLDFIIHPGETVKEVLEQHSMLQEELAIRTGFTPKHISEVINGKKGISPKFAKALEYVFGVKFTFWLNLQAIYDKEIIEYQERNNIDKKEIEITKRIEPILEYAILLGLIDDENSINVEDNQENEFQAGLMEQVENDLIVEANTTKDIEIRFNRSYSTQTEPRRINFNNIIKDYDAFNQDRQAYKDVVEIIVNL